MTTNPDRERWLCPKCRSVMQLAADGHYLACINMDSRLQPVPKLDGLPLGAPAIHRSGCYYPNTKLFRIDGEEGLWEYAPGLHAECLKKMPQPDIKLAATLVGGRKVARAFRLSRISLRKIRGG